MYSNHVPAFPEVGDTKASERTGIVSGSVGVNVAVGKGVRVSNIVSVNVGLADILKVGVAVSDNVLVIVRVGVLDIVAVALIVRVAVSDNVLVPAIYDRALTLYVAAQALLKERQYSKSARLMAEYYAELDRYRKDFIERPQESESNIKIVP